MSAYPRCGEGGFRRRRRDARLALEPDVLVDAPVKVITVSAKCYELTDVAVHLENPYPGDCEFVIVCENRGEVLEAMARRSGLARPSPAVSRRRRRISARHSTWRPDGARSGPVDRSVYPDAFGLDRKSVNSVRVRRSRWTWLPALIIGPHSRALDLRGPDVRPFRVRDSCRGGVSSAHGARSRERGRAPADARRGGVVFEPAPELAKRCFWSGIR